MATSNTAVFILISAWVAFFFSHSLLANQTVKHYILSTLPGLTPCYRMGYNIVAIIMLIPIIVIHALNQSQPVFQWPSLFSELNIIMMTLATLGFIWSLKYYDLQAFTGIRSCLNKNAPTPQEKLTISPLHRFVRHPWYLFALVIIWSREQNQLELISSTLMTVYFFVGARLEEKKLIREYGESYQQYINCVPGIIPRPWKFLSIDEALNIEQRALRHHD